MEEGSGGSPRVLEGRRGHGAVGITSVRLVPSAGAVGNGGPRRQRGGAGVCCWCYCPSGSLALSSGGMMMWPALFQPEEVVWWREWPAACPEEWESQGGGTVPALSRKNLFGMGSGPLSESDGRQRGV